MRLFRLRRREEPTDCTKRRPHVVPATTEVVGQLGQDVVDLAEVFVRIPEGVALDAAIFGVQA